MVMKVYLKEFEYINNARGIILDVFSLQILQIRLTYDTLKVLLYIDYNGE